jgi:Ulp1 family protease
VIQSLRTLQPSDKSVPWEAQDISNTDKYIVKSSRGRPLYQLGDDELVTVNEIFESRRTKMRFCTIGTTRLTYNDIKTLRPGVWVNEKVCNAFLDMLPALDGV